MTIYLTVQLIMVFIFGILFGSFLNVCIFRIPRHEEIVYTPSHCMTCGYKLKWYDNVPLFSFIAIKGKCRQCKTKLSLQYPIIEAVNGVLYVLVFMKYGLSIDSVLFCFFLSTLLVISVIDWRTYEIPLGCNIFIAVLGIAHLVLHRQEWVTYVIGFFAVSGFLLIIYVATKGRGIGGGDVKLMAVAGLLLGWKLILVAFVFGCVLGAVLHLLRMKITKADHVLAFGPYLSMGLLIVVFWGEKILQFYLGMF